MYLEAQIQNITPGAIYMEKVSLEPSAQYTAVELNFGKSGNKYASLFFHILTVKLLSYMG